MNGDTISRQAAIDLLKNWSGGYDYIEIETEAAIKEFQQLPSAQPEPLTDKEQRTFLRAMTLRDLISCETLINDDTRLGLILWDPVQCAVKAQAYGRWFEDHILTYMNWTVEHFTYWAASNRLVIRISQEGANQ